MSVAGLPAAARFVGKLELFRAASGSAALLGLLFLGGALSFVYAFQVYQYDFWRGERTGPRAGRPQQALIAGLAVLVLALGLSPSRCSRSATTPPQALDRRRQVTGILVRAAGLVAVYLLVLTSTAPGDVLVGALIAVPIAFALRPRRPRRATRRRAHPRPRGRRPRGPDGGGNRTRAASARCRRATASAARTAPASSRSRKGTGRPSMSRSGACSPAKRPTRSRSTSTRGAACWSSISSTRATQKRSVPATPEPTSAGSAGWRPADARDRARRRYRLGHAAARRRRTAPAARARHAAPHSRARRDRDDRGRRCCTLLSYLRDVSYYIDAALALALLSFTATLVAARYVRGGGPF